MEPGRAKAALEHLLELGGDRRLEGAVLYELWRLEPGHEGYRERAAKLCRDLYIATADVEMGFRFTELTGESLPKLAPLPDLSARDLLHSGDMERLLREADQMISGVVGEAACEDNGPR
jgi:hypothetical protein